MLHWRPSELVAYFSKACEAQGFPPPPCPELRGVPACAKHTLGMFPPLEARIMTAARTSTTSLAGLPKDLSSPRDALSRELRAASASCNAQGNTVSKHCAEKSRLRYRGSHREGQEISSVL